MAEREPFFLHPIDLIPLYGISTHGGRCGENAPAFDDKYFRRYAIKSIGRGALLGAYNISVLAGVLGLEHLILHS